MMRAFGFYSKVSPHHSLIRVRVAVSGKWLIFFRVEYMVFKFNKIGRMTKWNSYC
jgi:hypothetical protein